jgi:hypothetical protein
MHAWGRMSWLAALGLSLVGVGSAQEVRAEEPAFGYTFTTDLLPKGKWEVEQGLTVRRTKAGGDFTLFEHKSEIEYGVSDRLQVGLQAQYFQARSRLNGPDGTTTPPESFAEKFARPDGRFNREKLVGVSVEGIYRMLSPYVDPIGLALVVEPTIGDGLRELETRIVFQKNFMEDAMILGANLTLIQEERRLPGDPEVEEGEREARSRWDRETDLNFSFAASYRFISNWSAGFEFMNEREYSSFRLAPRHRTNSAYYVGPVVHYGGQRFFITATFLTQLPWGHDYANPSDEDAIVRGRNFADDFERYRLRIKAGITF